MSELKTQVTLRTANSCLGRAGNKDVGASLPSPALRPTPYPLILKGVGELAMLVPTGYSLIPYLALTRPRPAGQTKPLNFNQVIGRHSQPYKH